MKFPSIVFIAAVLGTVATAKPGPGGPVVAAKPGPGGPGMILVREGRRWESYNPVTGRRCFPGPADALVCDCGKGEKCVRQDFGGCTKCKRKPRNLRSHFPREKEYLEVNEMCNDQYPEYSIKWAECINAGYREISGYTDDGDEDY